MATHSQRLAEFAERLKYEDIPAEVVARAKLHILDILGIGLAASELEYARLIAETSRVVTLCRGGERPYRAQRSAGTTDESS